MQTLVSIAVTLIVLAFVVFVLLAILGTVLKVTREYERLVVFRLGRSIGAKGPGLVLLIPFIDTATKVDLREQFMEVPSQEAITKDNAPISVDFLTYWKVFDPENSVLKVGNFAAASQGIATTTLRAVIGDISLDDVLAQRERINSLLRNKLDEVTERWGVKVTAVEIREIVPPRDVQDAMNRQMSAERTRRAVVTEADGKRAAQITMAEGEKQAAVLKAEGAKQAMILEAEAIRQSQLLKAQGYAGSLDEIYKTARNLERNTLLLQYLDALKQIGSSPSTKYIFPMEVLSLVQPLMASLGNAAAPAPSLTDADASASSVALGGNGAAAPHAEAAGDELPAGRA